jgi:nucleotide-binding universal stress UspA family protein
MYKKIIVGMDGSQGAENALPFAIDMAERDGASIVLAHVEEATIGKGGGPLRVDEPEIEAALHKQADELTDRGIDARVVTAKVIVGGAAPAIVQVAEDEGADLIVVGSRGRSGLAGIVLGSVAHRLLHLANQAVLVVTPNAKPSARAETGKEAVAG